MYPKPYENKNVISNADILYWVIGPDIPTYLSTFKRFLKNKNWIRLSELLSIVVSQAQISNSYLLISHFFPQISLILDIAFRDYFITVHD